MSGDPRAAAVFRASNAFTIDKIANPHATRVAHTLLRARADVENVVMEADRDCTRALIGRSGYLGLNLSWSLNE